MAPTVDLLHLSRPVNPARPARHSLGSASDLAARLAAHATGQGARRLAAAVGREITWDVVRTWAGGRALERTLKNRKNAPRGLCPICRGRTGGPRDEGGPRAAWDGRGPGTWTREVRDADAA